MQLTEARLLTVSEGDVEVAHESLLREWPRYRVWLEEDRVGRRLHAHLAASAREWDAHGRDSADLYRGQRLTGALDWSAQNPGELSPVEREFVDRSRVDAERQQRRLRTLLAGVAVLLAISVLAGIFALVKQHSAANSARVALARELGAEAVSEPRIDLAMLLAREAINLDTDRQTEGTLLTTLLRSPAALGTFALPIDARPQSVALSPNGRTLAVTDNNGELWFYDTRTRAVKRTLTDIAELEAPVYSSDGSLLIYDGSEGNAVAVVRDAHTLRLLGKLSYDRRWYALPGADSFAGNYLVGPGDRTVFYGYWVTNSAGGPGTAYVDRWSLPTGRLLSSTAAGPGPLLAMRLVAGGTRLLVVNATDSVVLDAHSMRRLSTIAITPAPGERATAAISPDGRAAAIGAATGAVSFVDLATGRSRPAVGGHTASVVRVVYSPDGREVVTTGNDNKVIVWDPKTADLLEILSGHADAVHGAAIGADDQTLYTSSLDGIVLEWDLGSDRRFGHPFATGPGLASGAVDTPGTPPLAISPNRATFAVRIGQATVGLFSTQSLREQSSFTIAPRGGVLTALAWSPDGAQLAVTGHGGTGPTMERQRRASAVAVADWPGVRRRTPGGCASRRVRTGRRAGSGQRSQRIGRTRVRWTCRRLAHRHRSAPRRAAGSRPSRRLARVLARWPTTRGRAGQRAGADPRSNERKHPQDATSTRERTRRTRNLPRLRPERNACDGIFRRHRPTVEHRDRPSRRASATCRLASHREHRLRPIRRAVRDHRRIGRHRQALVHLNTPAGRRSVPRRLANELGKRGVLIRRPETDRDLRQWKGRRMARHIRLLGTARLRGGRTQPKPRRMGTVRHRLQLRIRLSMSDNGGLHAGRSYVRRRRDQQTAISWREPVGNQRRSHKLCGNPGSRTTVAASLACAGCAIGWRQR